MAHIKCHWLTQSAEGAGSYLLKQGLRFEINHQADVICEIESIHDDDSYYRNQAL